MSQDEKNKEGKKSQTPSNNENSSSSHSQILSVLSAPALPKTLELKPFITLQVPKESKDEVGVGGSKMTEGNIIFTTQLASCIGVVAKLNNGEFVIYHASATYPEADGFKEFVNSLKGQVGEVYVLQKKADTRNYAKAPILADNLRTHLEKHIKVQVIELNRYTAIVCDAQDNKLYVIEGKLKKEFGSQAKISINSKDVPSDLEFLIDGLEAQDEKALRELIREKKFPFTKEERISTAMNIRYNPANLNLFLKIGLGHDFDKKQLLELLNASISLNTNNLGFQALWRTILSNEMISTDDLNSLLTTKNPKNNATAAAAIIESGRAREVGLEKILRLSDQEIVAQSLLKEEKAYVNSLAKEVKSAGRLETYITNFGKEFVMMLLKEGRFRDGTFSEQQKLRIALDHEEVAFALVVDPWSYKQNTLTNSHWMELLVKHPSAAEAGLGRSAWKIFDEANRKDDLLEISKTPKNAYNIIQRFGRDEKKADKFPPIDWMLILKNAKSEALKMIPSNLYRQFSDNQLTALLNKNPYLAISILKTCDQKSDNTLINLAKNHLSGAMLSLPPLQRAEELRALNANNFLIKTFGKDFLAQYESVPEEEKSSASSSFTTATQPTAPKVVKKAEGEDRSVFNRDKSSFFSNSGSIATIQPPAPKTGEKLEAKDHKPVPEEGKSSSFSTSTSTTMQSTTPDTEEELEAGEKPKEGEEPKVSDDESPKL